MSAYEDAAHKVQTAIAFLMGFDKTYAAVQPKHMRVGIDMTKSDMGGLMTLLIEKGVFTTEEYVAAITKAAEQEAEEYQKMVQSVVGARNISLG